MTRKQLAITIATEKAARQEIHITPELFAHRLLHGVGIVRAQTKSELLSMALNMGLDINKI